MTTDVLLVEPDNVIRRHLAILLTRNDHHCEAVTDLRSARDACHDRHFAFIILDLDAPLAASGEDIHWLLGLRSDTRVIALETAADRARLPGAAFHATIRKPFVFDALLHTLRAPAGQVPA